ncbi:plastocyanin/azurin family copper-binding protein [Dokdonella soli]|uniref:Blue (type 1) copper domain-containing protein n=1 Tax=Dokdonella soli TaxID=529810 RepID=A0ABP3TIX1_9GAMM
MRTISCPPLLFAASAFFFAAPALAANHIVNVGGSGLVFSPSRLTITAGDTVTFTNAGGFHNVASAPGAVTSFRCASGCDGDGVGGNGAATSTGWSAVVAFPKAGTVPYYCEVHGAPGQGMSGTLTVQAAPAGNVAITAGFTGTWADASQSGQAGFGLEVLPGNKLVAEWYTFGPQGGQSWIGGVGDINGTQAVITGFQILGPGGMFPPNFNKAQVQTQPWGTMTFTFTDCNNGTVSWAPTAAGYTAGSLPITRVTEPAGLTCP